MRLLFAEDDRDLNRAVSTILRRAGYAVDAVFDGREALDYALAGEYDGAVLDVMMPRLSGVELVAKLREKGVFTPCLLLTAKDQLQDKVEGLDAGADDYLTKPFETEELLARVRALLRRKERYEPDLLRFGDLQLDKNSFTLSCGGKEARLGNKAFQVLLMLMENPRCLLSVSQFMDRVWGWDSEAEINVVWVNISYLRKKIAELGSSVEIRAQRGVGYSLETK